MCSFSIILRIITLDNLYPLSNTKGKINWLIFAICKVMAPALLVLVTENDEIKTYGNSMMEHYKKSLRGDCADIKILDKIDFNSEKKKFELDSDLSLNELLQELEASGRSRKNDKPGRRTSSMVLSQSRLYPEPSRADKVLGAKLQSYLMLLQSANMTSPLEEKGNYHDMKFCCENYRKIAREAVMCMRKQQSESAHNNIHFGIVMFCPCFSAILVALVLAPFKHVPTLRVKLFTDEGSNLQSTPQEKLDHFKDCLHFVADLAAFYIILYKIQVIGTVITGPCVQRKLCLTKYTSLQMFYLLAVAQTPWISILWNFAY